MNTLSWQRFLKRWSQEIIETFADDQGKLPSEVRQSGWLGYPGATEAEIAQAETRLGIGLPPSYRAFLKVTNGWRQTTPFIPQLWSTTEIEWFAVRHQNWINAFSTRYHEPSIPSPQAGSLASSVPDADYFVYGDEQDCSRIRVEYLQTTLEISCKGDSAIYLLNPEVITAQGEWEAWFFGDWLPGADRYRSFADMMQAEYESFLELRETPLQQTLKSTLASEPVLTPGSACALDLPDELVQHMTNPIPVSDASEWHTLSSFSVEFQTRQVADLVERRTLMRHRETDTIRLWAEHEFDQLQVWMLPQIDQAAQPLVTVEITQLQIMRSLWDKNPLVANKTQRLLPESVRAGEPLILAVCLHLAGLTPEPKVLPLTYRTQAYARHLPTGAVSFLGDIVTNILMAEKSAYTVLFSQVCLEHPGAYRLKVIVTPQNPAAHSAFFKVPCLQVI